MPTGEPPLGMRIVGLTVSDRSFELHGVVNNYAKGRLEELGEDTCMHIIYMCKNLFFSKRVWVEDGWQRVGWQDWCTVVGSTVTDHHFLDLHIERNHFRERAYLCNNAVPTHVMASQSRKDMDVLGVMLSLDRSWLDLVIWRLALYDRMKQTILCQSPCTVELVSFVTSNGCEPEVLDRQESNTLHIATIKGWCGVIDSLLSKIHVTEYGHHS